ncbi:MAG: M1 family metallopeptidase, partial [Thermoanaerobaculia bacterium]|nr:M1 family metallopeptidase [Thermoanaerobaculia bacterium]
MNRLRALALILILATLPVAAGEWPVRLGETVEPLSQSIDLHLDPEKDGYEGSTRFAIRVDEPLERFRLHAEEMAIGRSSLLGVGTDLDLNVEVLERGEILLHADRTIAPGDYTLEIEFQNDYGTRAVGLYKVTARDESSLFTQFQTADAREAFPIWDEPSFKIPYDLTLTIPAHLDAVSNTAVENVIESKGTKTIHFERTKPLPSYLLAIAVGEFDYVPIEGMSVPGRVVVPEGSAERGRLAAKLTPPILREMESYFGLRYPFEKLDLISVPEFWAAAMENAGAVTFRDTILLVDEENASLGRKRWLAKVIAHELAHMWFGNLVTLEWWNDLWLNESFADWFGDMIVDELFPEYRLGLSELEGVQQTMAFDARPSTGAVRREIDRPDAVLDTVGIAYNKGKAILSMFQSWIGKDRFREGLREYMREQAWGNSTAEEFFDALSSAAGFDIAPSMRTFLDQPSFPLIEVEMLGDGRVRLSQRRFSEAAVAVEPQSWIVPVILTYGHDDTISKQRFVLEDQQMVVDLGAPPSWMFPDADATAYYRWSVPDDMLLDLVIRSEAIMSDRQRLALVGNVTALLSAGEIDGGTYLEIMHLLASDEDPLVVEQALSSLAGIAEALVTPENRQEFAKYVREMAKPLIDRYGLEPRPGEDELVSELRPTLLVWLGLFGEDSEIRRWARSRLEDFLEDPSSIDPALGWAIVRLAAVDGDRRLFERYREEFESAKDPAVRRRFLLGLGEFGSPELQRRALDYALEGPLRSTEVVALASRIDQDEAAKELRWNWLTENYDRIVEKISPTSIPRIVTAAGGCSEQRLREAERFFVGKKKMEGTSERLGHVRDAVTACLNLRERELEAVGDW